MIREIWKRQPGAILADEMGLGKTILTLDLIRRIKTVKRILIIAPAMARRTWAKEIERKVPEFSGPGKLQMIDTGSQIPFADIIITSYELASSGQLYDELLKISFDVMVVDEAHYLCNIMAGRTVALLGSRSKIGIFSRAKRVLFLTGTPFLNAAVDVYPILKRAAPQLMASWNHEKFGQYFATEVLEITKDDRTIDIYRGFKNKAELKELLSTSMVRRLKKDVLPDLPDKLDPIVYYVGEGDRKLKKLLQIERQFSLEDVKNALPADGGAPLDDINFRKPDGMWDIARVRAEIGVQKIPHLIAIIKEVLQSREKAIIFAYHIAVLEGLFDALPEFRPLMVTGTVSHNHRSDAEDLFQEDPTRRVFLGQLKAAGVALTLTAADYVLMAEPWWNPAVVNQAIDRAHRYGQKADVQPAFALVPGSLDEAIFHCANTKQSHISEILD